MRYTYILIVLLIGVFAACGVTNSDEDEAANKIVGTWEIVSADSAVWIGESNNFKAKSDTLFISEPGDYGLSVNNIYEDNDGNAMLTLIDSTFFYDETYPASDLNYIYEYTGDPYIISLGGGTRGFKEFGVYATIGVNYNCGESPTQDEVFEFKIAVKDSVIRHYYFVVHGFVDTINELSC